MPPAESHTLALRLPRVLLDPGRSDLPCGDHEGLLSLRLHWCDGVITAMEAIAADPSHRLAITPLVDAHVHLDKAFSWEQFPNLAGTMQGALAANWREGEQRSAEQVFQRGSRALEQAWRYGLRALRSHVDSGSACGQPSWEALLQLQKQWRGRIDLQLVALAPLPFWSQPEGELLARQWAASGGLLGGVIGPPFVDSNRDGESLQRLLQLAADLGCGIDLHIDESVEAPAAGLQLLLRQLDRWHPGVPITCSHASSLALLPEGRARRLAQRMQRHRLAVVALPTTNFWLLGRPKEQQMARRPSAPVRLLQQEGVAVAIGADNVQDPWYPGGDFDPLELLRLAFRAFHTPPWQRQGLMPFTTIPSALMNLAWDGVLRVGGPADLLLTSATCWSDCLARPPQRRVLRQGQWLPAPESISLL